MCYFCASRALVHFALDIVAAVLYPVACAVGGVLHVVATVLSPLAGLGAMVTLLALEIALLAGQGITEVVDALL
jgi:hypothetical protein